MSDQLDWVSQKYTPSRVELPPPKAHRHDPVSSHNAARAARKFAHGHATRVLAAVRAFPLSTSAELAEAIRMDLYQVRRRLTDLLDAGQIRRIDPTDNTVPCRVGGKRVCRWEVR